VTTSPSRSGGWRPPRPRRHPRLLTRPEEGWVSLVLLLGMLAVVGISVADARPLAIDGRASTGPLVVAVGLAGLVGFVLARSPLGLLKAHLIGATTGAMVLLVVCATAASTDASPAGGLALISTRAAELSARFSEELALFLGTQQVPPTTLTLFLLGALLWTTGQASAFAIFRQHRAGPAVIATGTLLVLNEALPALEPAPDRIPMLATLAVYACLALLLLVRLQLDAQRRHWARRHISDSGEVSRLFLRSGIVFVVIVVTVTTSLTAVATMAPQRVDLEAFGQPLQGLRAEMARWLTVIGVDVPAAPEGFEDRLVVPDTWEQGQGVAFEADVPGGLRGNYWWGSAFADFDGTYWERDETSEDMSDAGEPLDMPVDASGAGPEEIVASLTPRASTPARSVVFAASEVASVSEPVRVRSLGDREGLAEVLLRDEVMPGAGYATVSFTHDYRTRRGSLTASQLRAAGTDYPAWIDRYTEVRAGASGDRTRAFARQIEARAAAQGHEQPFDKAHLVQEALQRFEYDTDVSDLCPDSLNVPECLLVARAGFCLHFASTMVMVLREMDIPARLVNGFLPGFEEGQDHYRVPLAALHAWVEVYFPGVGWVRFDPTPGGQLDRFGRQATELAEGDPVGTPDPTGLPEEPLATEPPLVEPSPSPAGPAETETTGGGGPGDLATLALEGLALGAALLGVAAVLLAVRLRRLPHSDGRLAFGRIVGLATRLGHGPHPSQTEYEYAATLSETVPLVRDDLFVVAHASVEQRYGQRAPAGDAQAALRRAYARVRTALLRLAWGRRR
jgi:hypothetical protein